MRKSLPGPARGSLEVGLIAVVLAVTREDPRVLTVRQGGPDALPSGPLDPAGDRTLERALRRWVRARSGLEVGYAEQLYTFADRFRDPEEHRTGRRSVAVAYLALVREAQPGPDLAASWSRVYGFFPWEDWRDGRPQAMDEVEGALGRWAGPDPGRRERAAITFGLAGATWDEERVLERFELLYEVGLVAEARGDPSLALGLEMAVDHRRILATALGRLRAKIKYRPVIFELLPEVFTLLQLQNVVEALAGVRLHKQNFRRVVENAGLVEGTGTMTRTGGRPAELFRFRREVLRERPAPGVGLPASRR
ncbi:MAG: hypothetical protein AB1758_24330, partial [Candidatus Eremiobacterota bacterium]